MMRVLTRVVVAPFSRVVGAPLFSPLDFTSFPCWGIIGRWAPFLHFTHLWGRIGNMASKKVIVFGGNGFLGSCVCRKALAAGWNVVVACRSGAPVDPKESWVDKVEWMAVDALDRPSVYTALSTHPDTTAVVTTIGLLTTDRKRAQRTNGDANVNIAAAVYESKTISRYVFVSAARMPPFNRIFLKGYYEGKERCERAIRETLATRGVILRPGMIYGPRLVRGYHIPLGLIGVPLEIICRPFYNATGIGLLTPAISVDVVAAAAMHAAGSGSIIGVHEYDSMQRLAEAFTKSDISR